MRQNPSPRLDARLARALWWLLWSVLLHGVLALLLTPLWWWSQQGQKAPKSPPLRLVVTVPPEEPEPDEPDPVTDWDGQLVDTPPPPQPERPLDADYLAEHNQRVEQETRTDQVRVNPEVLSPQYSPDDKLQLEDLLDVGATEQSTGAKVGNERFEPDRNGRLAALPSPYHITNRDGVQAPMMSSSSAQSVAGAPNNDRLDEELGQILQLNTKEFLYAAYINRIRRLVNFYWQQNLDNLGGRILLPRPSYTTVVGVALAADGSLETVQVLQASGASPLDLAVIEAFRLAGPFPPPPAGLLERDGLAYLDGLGFTVEVGGGPAPFMGVDPRAGVQYPGLMKSPR